MPAQPQDAAGRRLRREMHCSHEIAKAQMVGAVIVCRLSEIGRRSGAFACSDSELGRMERRFSAAMGVMRGLRLLSPGRGSMRLRCLPFCCLPAAGGRKYGRLCRAISPAAQYARLCRAMFSLRCEHTRGLRGYVPDGAARRLASIRRASGSFGLAGRNARKCGEIQNS